MYEKLLQHLAFFEDVFEERKQLIIQLVGQNFQLYKLIEFNQNTIGVEYKDGRFSKGYLSIPSQWLTMSIEELEQLTVSKKPDII